MASIAGTDLLSVASAIGLLVLAAAVLAPVPRRGPALMLGLFSLSWAGQLLLLRAAFVLEPAEESRALLLASQAFYLPAIIFFAHFVAVFPRRAPITSHRAWPLLLVAPAVSALALAVTSPTSLVDPTALTVWGWATIVFLFLPLLIAMLAGLLRFSRGVVESGTTRERHQLRLASAALLLYLTYFLVDNTLFLAGSADALVRQFTLPGFAVYAGGLAVGLVVIGRAAFRLARGALALTLAVVSAGVGAALIAYFVSGTELSGLFRLAAVALLYYAIARYQLLDLNLRLRPSVRVLAAAAVALGVWGTLAAMGWWVLGAGGSVAFATAGLLGVGAGLLSLAPFERFLERNFPYVRASEEYRLRRKMEVYHAALGDGLPEEDLALLARDLKLSARARRLVAGLEAPRAPSAVGVTLGQGRYAVRATLAIGVFGRVMLAWDARLQETVVVKEYAGWMGGDASRSFAREARALGSIEHANVLQARDVFRDGLDLYLVLDHAEGGSLADALERGPLPANDALKVFREVLSGLAAAHATGIVHRDLKPGNVLFRRGVAKVADFGVALDPILDRAFRDLRTQPGTLAWMSPEQARGEPTTPASDVYSAGALLLAMLTGKPPRALEGLDERAAQRAAARGIGPLPAGVPAALRPFLSKCLVLAPRDRYPDAQAAVDAIPRSPLEASTVPPTPLVKT